MNFKFTLCLLSVIILVSLSFYYALKSAGQSLGDKPACGSMNKMLEMEKKNIERDLSEKYPDYKWKPTKEEALIVLKKRILVDSDGVDMLDQIKRVEKMEFIESISKFVTQEDRKEWEKISQEVEGKTIDAGNGLGKINITPSKQ